MKAPKLPPRAILVIEDEGELRTSLSTELQPFPDKIFAFAESGSAFQWFNVSNRTADVIARQLLKAGTSPGADFRRPR